MEVAATAKWVDTTARKARLVAATVEGLPVGEALTILAFTPRAAATAVAKVIKSAAANAEHNYNLDAGSLRVARIEVEGAAIIKRFRPRAQGRAYSIFRRTAHLRAFVTDEGAAVQPRRRRVAAAPAEETPAPRRRRSTPAAPAEGGTRSRGRARPAAGGTAERATTRKRTVSREKQAQAAPQTPEAESEE